MMRNVRHRRTSADALLITVTAALVCTGCIPQSARNDARLLAALTQKVKTDGVAFTAFRDDLDRARQRNIDVLEENVLEVEQATRHVLDVWDLSADKKPLEFFTKVHAATDRYAQALKDMADLRARQAKEMAELRRGVEIRSSQLEETAKALARLAEAPNFQAQAQFLIGYAKDLNEVLKKARAKAAEEANTAKKGVEKKGEDTQKAAKAASEGRRRM
jgi:hypothetical protein